MKILIRQFLGELHSWAGTGLGIAEALKDNHQVDLFATDGIKHFPKHLKSNLIGYTEEGKQQVFGRVPDNDYDCQISYTSMKNFPMYLGHGNKNRFGIWCYEHSGQNLLPNGFAKHYKSCDFLCPPSEYAKRVFMESQIPENIIKVIPHGINKEQYSGTSTMDLKTNKKFKILANIAQNHIRKNIPGLLEAYGKAFNNKDDICLILKAKEKPIKFGFDVSLNDCLNKFKSKYPKHAEIKILSKFIDDMSALYRSVDAVYSLSNCECFLYPALESIASGKIMIAPNWGGQIDFLNNDNALLIDGKEARANPKSMYWESKNNAIWFEPSIDDAVEKLKYAYQNFEELNKKVKLNRENILNEYSWSNIGQRFINLCQ